MKLFRTKKEKLEDKLDEYTAKTRAMATIIDNLPRVPTHWLAEYMEYESKRLEYKLKLDRLNNVHS